MELVAKCGKNIKSNSQKRTNKSDKQLLREIESRISQLKDNASRKFLLASHQQCVSPIKVKRFHDDGSLKSNSSYLYEITKITEQLTDEEYKEIIEDANYECLSIMFAGIKN